ncbi:hypothetical protein [Bradyrhizobium japonicum]|nr:hypothetical protein [Bradyrhizobium japonicum]
MIWQRLMFSHQFAHIHGQIALKQNDDARQPGVRIEAGPAVETGPIAAQ